MKKIILASLVMLALGSISYGQTAVKTAQKRETVKPISSVSPSTPTVTKSKTKTSTTTDPVAATSTQKAPATAIRKHKKIRKTAKKVQ